MRDTKTGNFSFPAALAVLLGSTVAALADMELAPPGGAATTNNDGPALRHWAQPNDRMGGPQVGERLIDHLLANDKLTAEIGLQADIVAKLREESHAIQTQQADLNTQIRKLSIEQANCMSKLLLSPDANTNEVMQTVEEIGRLRTEQAKLTVRNLMIVRKYLTPDQIRKARELMRAQMQNKDGNKDGEVRSAKKGTLAPAAGTPAPKPPEGW
jgi:Spy/CpxP family protein refolding chaperone